MVDHQNKRAGSLTLSSGRARSVKIEGNDDVADGFQRLQVDVLVKEEEGNVEQILQGAAEVMLASLVEDFECSVCLDIL